MATRLHVSIGPVQGFVAQSRRTRDLWAGSYLLSYLSAHALRGAVEAGGKIVQPLVDGDPLYRLISGLRNGEPPRLGSVPNHLVLEIQDAPSVVARATIEAFTGAWNRVCGEVWRRFVQPACDAGLSTELIWKRQVGSFWEIVWVAGPPGTDGLLARRKHWRSHRLPDEPGDKCTIMHDFQELSGYVRANPDERLKQDAFWERVRERLDPLDLRPDERLCAIALVKRLFPLVSGCRDVLGARIDTAHWPSTVKIAAVPWVREVLKTEPAAARDFAARLKTSLRPGYLLTEAGPPLEGVDLAAAGDFSRLGGDYFHEDFLKDDEVCPLDREDREDIIGRLEEICKSSGPTGQKIGRPPVYYAILLADGDLMGRLVGEIGPGPVGQALSHFTSGVPHIVTEHDGVTIYAGGDDVLAMLPIGRALDCARALARSYHASLKQALRGQDPDRRTGERSSPDKGTLSASIVFAHVNYPLTAVLAEARRLLDDVAKRSNGRDSLAAEVLKRGGPHCQWATTWARLDSSGTALDAVELVSTMTSLLRGNAEGEPALSSTLVFRICETLDLLCGLPWRTPGAWSAIPEGLDIPAIHKFVLAEVLGTLGDSTETARAAAGEVAELVCNLLRRSRAGQESRTGAPVEIGLDSLLLACFLAKGGHEEAKT